MCVGHRDGSQSEAIIRFSAGALHHVELQFENAYRFFGQSQVEVALRRSKHQGLTRRLPFELGHVDREPQLLLLHAAFRVVERLNGQEGPAARRTVGHGGVEAYPG
jgi:hypothetical protein